jgi:type II secretory pathway component PulK
MISARSLRTASAPPIGGFLVTAGFAIALGTTGVIYVVGAVLLLVLVGNFTVTPTMERQPINVEIRDGRRWSMFVDIIGSFALVAAPAVVPARPSSAWQSARAATGVSGNEEKEWATT